MLIARCAFDLDRYDYECTSYEKDVTKAKREYLASELLKVYLYFYIKYRYVLINIYITEFNLYNYYY